MAIIGVLTLLGCSLHGPAVISVQRMQYNQSLQTSEAEELLLNLVRLRYHDLPEFLAVSAITSQLSFRGAASVGGDFGNVEDSDSAFLSPNLAGSYSESPTVSLIPRHDEEFYRQLITPIPLDSILLLSFNDWGIDRLLTMFAKSINGMPSYSPLRNQDAAHLVSSQEFMNLTQALKSAELKGGLGFAFEQRREQMVELNTQSDDIFQTIAAARTAGFEIEPGKDGATIYAEETAIVLWMNRGLIDHKDYQFLAQRLDFDHGMEKIDVVYASGQAGRTAGKLGVEPRSPAGVLTLLAAAVQVPDDHGERFGLPPNLQSEHPISQLLSVRFASTPPQSAWLAIPYREYYFYIDNADLYSRQTLAAASAFIHLTLSRDDDSFIPVVTLPVGS